MNYPGSSAKEVAQKLGAEETLLPGNCYILMGPA